MNDRDRVHYNTYEKNETTVLAMIQHTIIQGIGDLSQLKIGSSVLREEALNVRKFIP